MNIRELFQNMTGYFSKNVKIYAPAIHLAYTFSLASILALYIYLIIILGISKAIVNANLWVRLYYLAPILSIPTGLILTGFWARKKLRKERIYVRYRLLIYFSEEREVGEIIRKRIYAFILLFAITIIESLGVTLHSAFVQDIAEFHNAMMANFVGFSVSFMLFFLFILAGEGLLSLKEMQYTLEEQVLNEIQYLKEHLKKLESVQKKGFQT